MKLAPPIDQYLSKEKPTHCVRPKLNEHISFLSQGETTTTLTRAGYLTEDGKVSKKAQLEGLVDVCDGKALWNLKLTKKALLDLTRKPTTKPAPAVGVSAPKVMPPAGGMSAPRQRSEFTDLENIGTYFGVGKNKIGSWLDELGLRGYKAFERNESGDIDMLDMAAASKEKFRSKVPTERALEFGYAQMETIEYTKKGETKSFDKYSWHLEKIKNLLVKAGHPLDTERKMLLKGKGKNSSVTVSSIDDRVDAIYNEWKKLYKNPATRDSSWKMFQKQPRAMVARIEQKLGYPGFIQNKLYTNPSNMSKIVIS